MDKREATLRAGGQSSQGTRLSTRRRPSTIFAISLGSYAKPSRIKEGAGRLQRGTALAVILALSLVLAAFSGSAEEETREEASEAPAPAQAAAAPQPEPTPAENTA